jgi:adenylate cyclase
MPNESNEKRVADLIWYWYLIGDDADIPENIKRMLAIERAFYGLLPGKPRCVQCNVPLAGVGTLVAGPVLGLRPSSFTPRLCDGCERMVLKSEGGAEVELSLLFADIRGSTTLAEETPPAEYTKFIQRFYKAGSGVLIERNALVNRLAGDQVIGLFVPRFAGPKHARVAIQAAIDILKATGHADPGGPWAPVGVGVHTGRAYVGAVGAKDGANEIAVLGNAANLTARLSSSAAKGEVLISDEAASAANWNDGTEKRELQLNGISKPVSVRVARVGSL